MLRNVTKAAFILDYLLPALLPAPTPAPTPRAYNPRLRPRIPARSLQFIFMCLNNFSLSFSLSNTSSLPEKVLSKLVQPFRILYGTNTQILKMRFFISIGYLHINTS